jgi:hypothetical protein
MRDADGTVSGIIVLGVDVTEAKRAEKVLYKQRSWPPWDALQVRLHTR